MTPGFAAGRESRAIEAGNRSWAALSVWTVLKCFWNTALSGLSGVRRSEGGNRGVHTGHPNSSAGATRILDFYHYIIPTWPRTCSFETPSDSRTEAVLATRRGTHPRRTQQPLAYCSRGLWGKKS